MGMAATQLGRRIGSAAKERIGRRKDPFMAAASRAIAERIPFVDLILHVTDARVLSSTATTRFFHFLFTTPYHTTYS